MKKISILFYTLLLCGALFVAYRIYNPQPPTPIGDTLIVGTNAEYPPYTFIKDKKIVGFDLDLVHEVAQRLGKKIIVVDMLFEMLLPNVQLGDVHIIAGGISPKPSRARHVLFTKPYLEGDPLLIISSKDKPLHSLDDLCGKTVIVNDGYTADAYVAGQATEKNILVQRLATPAEAFLALASGRADAYVAAQSSVQSFFEKYPGRYATSVIPDTTDAYALVISPRYPELLPQVQAALDEMTHDGTLATLKQKWKL